MSDPLFVAPAEALAAARPGDALELRGPEGHHAATVARLRVGERVLVTDGRGRLVTCQVLRSVPRLGVDLEVLAVVDQPERRPTVTVVQALPKGDRGDLAVELLTEVGVDVIVPWAASRCVTRWSPERAIKGRTRWEAVAVAAGKQSRSARFPLVGELAATRDVAVLVRAADRALLLHEEALAPFPTAGLPGHGSVVLVIGPEGGLDPAELDALGEAGGEQVRLGPTVLRTSTAGAVAAALVMRATGRW